MAYLGGVLLAGVLMLALGVVLGRAIKVGRGPEGE